MQFSIRKAGRGGVVACLAVSCVVALVSSAGSAFAQDDGPGPRGGFRGPPGGPGGFPGMSREKTPLVEKFDADGNGRLDVAERKAAREFLRTERAAGRGRGGFPGGPGGPQFGPGGMIATQLLDAADTSKDESVSKEELAALAVAWFEKLDPESTGAVSEEQFVERLEVVLPPPEFGGPGEGPPEGPRDGGPRGGGRRGGGRGGFGPGRFIGPGLFAAIDTDKSGSLTRDELRGTFETWAGAWDADSSGALDREELGRGLDGVLPQPEFGRGRGPGRGPRGRREPPRPGKKLTPDEVESYPDASVYDTSVLRTFFLEFETEEWEAELAEFKNTDVEVSARLMVDGKTYEDVGVRFRGASSFGMVGEGSKRSFNLSLDFVHRDQRLGGYRTLNLLNSNGDPTFLRAVLYSHIARQYLPAAQASLARVVINGESWGVYVNLQQLNKDFVKEWFDTSKGTRWKVPGSPGGRGGLEYLGEDVEKYKAIYQIASKDRPEAWSHLIRLCRVLSETPIEELEKTLEPLLDIDGALKFLALENALINDDGYWIRSSDYAMYQDVEGRFHIIPYDTNEAFMMPGGPGFGGGRRGRGGRDGGDRDGPGRDGGDLREERDGRGGGRDGARGGFGRGGPRVNGVELDPLVSADDPSKPLASRLLAVPALRERYLGYVRDIATKWLDWETLGPVAERCHALIADDVREDTRKLDSTEAFIDGLAGSREDAEPSEDEGGPGFRGFGPPGRLSLKDFATQRRAYLLAYEAKEPAAPAEGAAENGRED